MPALFGTKQVCIGSVRNCSHVDHHLITKPLRLLIHKELILDESALRLPIMLVDLPSRSIPLMRKSNGRVGAVKVHL
jgi:hypothetical protein